MNKRIDDTVLSYVQNATEAPLVERDFFQQQLLDMVDRDYYRLVAMVYRMFDYGRPKELQDLIKVLDTRRIERGIKV